MPMFMPVQMLETPTSTVGPVHSERASAPTSVATSPLPQTGMIEIELGDGRQVRVGSDVNLAALRRVLAALRG